MLAMLTYLAAMAAAWASTASSEVDEAKAALLCAPADSHFLIAGAADARSLDKRFPERRVVNYSALITTGPAPGNFRDLFFRTGTRTQALACGRFTIEFRGGFLNANPNGESGAVDDYPIVTISAGGRPVLQNMPLAPCETADLPRFRMHKGNAQVIEGRLIPATGETEIIATAEWCPFDGKRRTDRNVRRFR